MTQGDKQKFIVDAAYFALVAAIAVLTLKYFIWWLLPLVLGFGIAFALTPIVNAVYRLSTATRRFCAVIVLLCAYATLFALVWLGLAQLVVSLRDVFTRLPTLYSDVISPAVMSWNSSILAVLERFLPQLGVQFAAFTQVLGDQLSLYVTDSSAKLIEGVTAFIKGIPAMMLTFLFTVLSSFFISMDYNNVVSFLARLVPRRHRKTLFALKDFLVTSIFGYGKAYLLLLGFTFAQAWAGLWLLRVPSSGWLALGIALADLLPAVGTGLVLLPWAGLSLLQGNRFLCIGLLAVYGVITIVRNIIEPKIVGDQIGLPPLVTITAMFFGLKLFGVLGMFIMPIMALVLKFLCDSGHLRLWDKPAKPTKP